MHSAFCVLGTGGEFPPSRAWQGKDLLSPRVSFRAAMLPMYILWPLQAGLWDHFNVFGFRLIHPANGAREMTWSGV